MGIGAIILEHSELEINQFEQRLIQTLVLGFGIKLWDLGKTFVGILKVLMASTMTNSGSGVSAVPETEWDPLAIPKTSCCLPKFISLKLSMGLVAPIVAKTRASNNFLIVIKRKKKRNIKK